MADYIIENNRMHQQIEIPANYHSDNSRELLYEECQQSRRHEKESSFFCCFYHTARPDTGCASIDQRLGFFQGMNTAGGFDFNVFSYMFFKKFDVTDSRSAGRKSC